MHLRTRRAPIPRVQLAVGDRLQFVDDHRRVAWTVKAVSDGGRFAICTVPFNVRRSVLYTVLDFDSGVRGPDDYGGLGYETDEQITRSMRVLTGADPDLEPAEVSYRYDVYLRIDTVNGQRPQQLATREDPAS